MSGLNAFLPGTAQLKSILNGVLGFENGLKGIICPYFDGLPLKDNLFLEVKINNGVPQDNGFNCSNYDKPLTRAEQRIRNLLPGSEPDFLFRNSLPRSYKSRDSGAYLIGDVKLYLGAARNDILSKGKGRNQFDNMVEYAKKYQQLPFVSYLALTNSNVLHVPEDKNDPRGLSKSDRLRLAEIALQNGIILVLANIVDK